ncbi:MAG: hypothetical protein H0W64_01260 [Gammaproteobacteria bacterium]|nr:hypothetical protein [Gammaproteobacteria bacterium]
MKKLLASVIVISSSFLLNTVSAESVIIRDTSNWKSVPVQVDSVNKTYTLVGTEPTDSPNYYYSYQGYRCFREKREIGIDALIFKAGISGGSDIYCYSE